MHSNKIINKENKLINPDNKNNDGINNEAKFIKLKIGKNKNNFNTYNPSPYMGSPMKLLNLKNNILIEIKVIEKKILTEIEKIEDFVLKKK